MKILIVGGKREADYVIKAFNKPKNKIVVINDSPSVSKMLSANNGIQILNTDPTKLYSYEEADIFNFDLIIALMEKDADNFVACKIAKDRFAVKKAICTVSDPSNVEIFEALGIDTPISASYLLTQKIEGESDIESIIKTLSLENNKIIITEIRVRKEFDCCDKSLMQLQLPKYANVTCIFRNPNVIIPRGDTVIRDNDKLVIASAPNDQKKVIRFIKKEKQDANETDQAK